MVALGLIVFTAAALLGFMAAQARGPDTLPLATPNLATAKRAAPPPAPVRGDYGIALAPPAQRVQLKLKLALKSGLLFDVTNGQVLWERNPSQLVPIASLESRATAALWSNASLPRRLLGQRSAREAGKRGGKGDEWYAPRDSNPEPAD